MSRGRALSTGVLLGLLVLFFSARSAEELRNERIDAETRSTGLLLLAQSIEADALDPPKIQLTGSEVGACAKLGDRIDELEARVLEPEQTRRHYASLLSPALDRPCSLEAARVHSGLAAVENEMGDPLAALHQLEAAERLLSAGPDLGISEPGGLGRLRAKIVHNRGSAELRLGWLDEARESLRRSIRLSRAAGAPEEGRAVSLLELSRVERLRHDPEAALATAREGQRLAAGSALLASHHAGLWQASSLLHRDAGDLARAESDLARAVEILVRNGTGGTHLANLLLDAAGLTLERGNAGRALEELSAARGTAGPGGDLHFESTLFHLQSRALAEGGDLPAALTAADRGLDLLEAVRAPWGSAGWPYFSLRQQHFRHRLGLAVAAGDAHDAFRVFHRYRSRGLLARMASSEATPTSDDRGQLQELKEALVAAVRALDQGLPELETGAGPVGGEAASEHHRRLDAELRRARQAVLRWLGEPEAVEEGVPAVHELPGSDPAEALELLEPGELGLVYARGRRSFVLLILDPRAASGSSFDGSRGLEMVPLELDAERLGELVASVRTASSSGSTQARGEAAARELGVALLGPVEERLGEGARLVLAAEGDLEGLPFEVLPLPGSGRPLLETAEVAYVPSFAVLSALGRRRGGCEPPPGTALALGDPIFGVRDPRWPAGLGEARSADEALTWRRLEASGQEAERVAAHHGPGSALLRGARATRRELLRRAEEFRILHLATHAQSDPRQPERSRLLLSCLDTAGEKTGACDLYLPEIADLRLCGQLVVLSACSTAAGRRLEGEGTLGLARAFLEAGAGGVVATLWRVEDGAASELMVAFHRRLAAGESPAGALRRAKLELHGQGRARRAWAPFVYLGG